MESVHFLWIFQKTTGKKNTVSSTKVHPWDLEFAMSPDQGAQLSREGLFFFLWPTSQWKSCLDSRQSQLENWVFVDFTHLLGLPCRGDFHRRLLRSQPSLQRLLLLVPTQQQVRGNRRERCNEQLWDRSHGPSPMAWRVGRWELPTFPLQWTWLAMENHLSFHRRFRYIFNPGPFSSQLCYSTRATKCQRCHDWSVQLSYQI